MNFKTGADEHHNRLITAMEKSWSDLKPFRKHAKEIRDQIAGDTYGDRGGAKPIYINILRQMTEIYSRSIVSGTPKAMVSSPDYPGRRPFAENFTVNLNRRLQEVRLSSVAEDSFIAAISGPSVVKTGLAGGTEAYEFEGQFYDPGKPFSEVVSIDNLVIDMNAECIEKIDYIGDRFLRSKKWVKEYFELGKLDNPDGDRDFNGRFMGESRTSGVKEEQGKQFYEKVWVWEVFLPKENVVLTWPVNMPDKYKVRDWDGPEGGPYEMLQLLRIPGEVLPSSPASSIYHLHELVNRTMRKISRQTGRQKVITAYEPDAAEDADSIVNAEDGEAVRVRNIDGVKQHAFGGPDGAIHNIAIHSTEVASRMAGNLDALGGLAPQSETFKQDQLLQDAASSLIDTFRDKVHEFLKRIIYRHAWYMWVDDINEPRVNETRTILGFDVDVEFTFSNEIREGDFLEYNFDIDIYSMKKETPAEKAQKILNLANQFIIPNTELLMQSGLSPNIMGMIQSLAEYSDVPLDILLTSADPESMPTRPGEVAAPGEGMPAETHRTYERVSRPGTTPAGNNKNLMQANLGANPQNDTAASTFSKAV